MANLSWHLDRLKEDRMKVRDDNIAPVGVVRTIEQLENWFDNRFQLENLSKAEVEEVVDYLFSRDNRILFTFSPNFQLGRIAVGQRVKSFDDVPLKTIMDFLKYEVYSMFKIDIIKKDNGNFTSRIVCMITEKFPEIIYNNI